jgi:hypothetical protein
MVQNPQKPMLTAKSTSRGFPSTLLKVSTRYEMLLRRVCIYLIRGQIEYFVRKAYRAAL